MGTRRLDAPRPRNLPDLIGDEHLKAKGRTVFAVPTRRCAACRQYRTTPDSSRNGRLFFCAACTKARRAVAA